MGVRLLPYLPLAAHANLASSPGTPARREAAYCNNAFPPPRSLSAGIKGCE